MGTSDLTHDPEWNRCKHWLDAALHRGGDTLTLDDVKARIESGQYILWPAPDSAVVTQICPGGELNILLAGGTLERLADMLPSLEEFGRRMGCTLITILGRMGWSRSFVTRQMGYKAVAVLLGKPLTDKAHTG